MPYSDPVQPAVQGIRDAAGDDVVAAVRRLLKQPKPRRRQSALNIPTDISPPATNGWLTAPET